MLVHVVRFTSPLLFLLLAPRRRRPLPSPLLESTLTDKVVGDELVQRVEGNRGNGARRHTRPDHFQERADERVCFD